MPVCGRLLVSVLLLEAQVAMVLLLDRPLAVVNRLARWVQSARRQCHLAVVRLAPVLAGSVLRLASVAASGIPGT